MIVIWGGWERNRQDKKPCFGNVVRKRKTLIHRLNGNKTQNNKGAITKSLMTRTNDNNTTKSYV